MSVGGATDDSTRYVFRLAVVCPVCEGLKYRSYKTERSDDGSKTQWVRCACGHRYKIVWEIPTVGILDDDLD